MSTAPLNYTPGARFVHRSDAAIKDPLLRTSFRGAMDFLQAKRRTQFPDPDALETLRSEAEAIRRYSLSRLPDLLEQLETKLTANGIAVHWAETPEEANRIMLEIVRRHDAHLLIKGKSMVSEEVGFNHAMEAQGLEALESDMGEFIVQLAGEAPSHIIMPAIHKTKQQIAELFHDKLPGVPYTENVDELIATGRKILRQKFAAADIGISGVNFLVAETGTLCLLENEGNGRMCTTVPRVHIAITGIEKVVEKLEHIAPLFTALTRSATGQPVTTYLNLISGPRQPGEKDGPDEVHLVLLDNGRSQAYADQELRTTLQCIRCGACMNHCPIYARIGGHAYGTTYPGPVGTIISPHLLGLAGTHKLVTASSLCGACSEVCPVKIPIPQILVRLRNESQAGAPTAHPIQGTGSAHSGLMDAVWRGWALVYGQPAVYRAVSWLISRLRFLTPSSQGAWTSCRTPMKPAPRRLRDLLADRQGRQP